MSLQAQLDEIAAASKSKLPADAQAVMQRENDALVAAGVRDQAPSVGDEVPALAAEGADGPVTLAGALEDGPVVLTWFRGNW